MAARNSAAHYGWVSRSLHLVMAVGLLAMLPLGWQIATMQVSLSNLWLFGLHKSLGMTLLALALFRVVWHLFSPPPAPVGPMPDWQRRAARWGHRLLYAFMLLIPLSGWVASAATGPDVLVFGIPLPRIAPTSATIEATGFALHAWLSIGFACLLGLHIAAALYHQFRLGDGSIRRVFMG